MYTPLFFKSVHEETILQPMKQYKIISTTINLLFISLLIGAFLYHWIVGSILTMLFLITTGGVFPGYFIDELHELQEERAKKSPQQPKSSPYKKHIGRVVSCVSALRPQGEVSIDGTHIQALSRHPYIDKHSEVMVVDADLRGVIVEKTAS